MDKETFEVQATTPERLFARMYHDFIDCTLLSGDEKLIYMVLKRFMDFRYDSGEAFPSIETLCRLTEKTRPTITKTIKSLQKKGVIEVVRRGLNKSNLYKLADHPDMWVAESLDELKLAAQESEIDRSIRILENAGYLVTKKEEPASAPAKAAEPSPSNQSEVNNKPSSPKSQANSPAPISDTWDPYTVDDLMELYEYDIIIHDRPHLQGLLDVALRFLRDAINAPGPTKWIAGQERPIDEVREQLLSLTPASIIYGLDQFEGHTGEVTNFEGYLLTIFFKAKDQMELDLTNQFARDQAGGWGHSSKPAEGQDPV